MRSSGKIRDFTLEELKQFRLDGTKEAIPTLAEVLQLVDGQVPLLVEMKCEDLGVHVCEKADGILKNYRGNYVMESFNPFALLWYLQTPSGDLPWTALDEFPAAGGDL